MNAKYFFIVLIFAKFLPSDALSFFEFFELWRKYREIAVRTVILRQVLPKADSGQAPYYIFYNNNGVLGNISNTNDYSIYPWVHEILPCACVLSPETILGIEIESDSETENQNHADSNIISISEDTPSDNIQRKHHFENEPFILHETTKTQLNDVSTSRSSQERSHESVDPKLFQTHSLYLDNTEATYATTIKYRRPTIKVNVTRTTSHSTTVAINVTKTDSLATTLFNLNQHDTIANIGSSKTKLLFNEEPREANNSMMNDSIPTEIQNVPTILINLPKTTSSNNYSNDSENNMITEKSSSNSYLISNEGFHNKADFQPNDKNNKNEEIKFPQTISDNSRDKDNNYSKINAINISRFNTLPENNFSDLHKRLLLSDIFLDLVNPVDKNSKNETIKNEYKYKIKTKETNIPSSSTDQIIQYGNVSSGSNFLSIDNLSNYSTIEDRNTELTANTTSQISDNIKIIPLLSFLFRKPQIYKKDSNSELEVNFSSVGNNSYYWDNKSAAIPKDISNDQIEINNTNFLEEFSYVDLDDAHKNEELPESNIFYTEMKSFNNSFSGLDLNSQVNDNINSSFALSNLVDLHVNLEFNKEEKQWEKEKISNYNNSEIDDDIEDKISNPDFEKQFKSRVVNKHTNNKRNREHEFENDF